MRRASPNSSATIAHEVNQPLAAIAMRAETGLRWLSRDQPNMAKVEQLMRDIVSDARRASDIVQRIRRMATRHEPELIPLDLSDVVEEALLFVRHEVRSRSINLSVSLGVGLPIVLGDRIQLQQVIVNLLVNSIHAVMQVDGSRRLIDLETGVDEDDAVSFSIRDSGPGIADENLGRVFERFFTTREGGMGMGLAICQSIITAHGGSIAVSKSRRGWRALSIYPSRRDRKGEPIMSASYQSRVLERPRPAGNPAEADRPLVILVDDDDGFRGALHELMQSAGLDAIGFASTRDLLKAELPDRPGCFVADVRMPGVSGLDLQQQLVESGDIKPIIFLTAHGDIPMSVQAMKAGAVDFLTKPVRDQTLLDAIAAGIERDIKQRTHAQVVKKHESKLALLTPRERQVLREVATGRINKQIAFDLGISEVTVKLHRGNVMRKMQLASVGELVRVWEALPAEVRRRVAA